MSRKSNGSWLNCPTILKDAALWHAAHGRPVFPVALLERNGKIQKAPLIKRGFLAATTHAATIEVWWSQWPRAAIGMPCGEASGLDAFDYDTKAGDPREAMESLHAEFDLPNTLLVSTISGGLHEYVRHAPGLARRIGWRNGIDFLGEGGFIVLPPSRLPDGRGYSVVFDADPIECRADIFTPLAHTNPDLLHKNGSDAHILDLSDARPSADFDLWLAQSRQAGRWHDAAVRLTGNLHSRGAPHGVILDTLAPLLTMKGYTLEQTRAEIALMLRGAQNKWGRPTSELDVPSDDFSFLSMEEVGMRELPKWRVDGAIPELGLGVLFGRSGAFKSFVALNMALSIAHGRDWHGYKCLAAPVLYIAGEGTYAIEGRILAWLATVEGATRQAPFWLAPFAANLLDQKESEIVAKKAQEIGARFIVVDTLARSFGAGNENDAKDMNQFVHMCDCIRTQCGAFLLAVHHSGKDQERGARGSSVLRAAADVEITLERDELEMACSVRNTKQKDAAEFEPFRLRMVEAEGVWPLTGEPARSLIPVLEKEEAILPRLGGEPAGGPLQKLILSELELANTLTFGELKARCACNPGSLSKALRSLIRRGVVYESLESPCFYWLSCREK